MSRILVVDDHEQNRYLLECAFKGVSHEVTVTNDGAAALANARENPPDLILSDILMPTMDGFSLCRQWRADEKLKRIPFIFYTATYTDPKDEKFALSLGADRFVTKPQEPDVLVAIVNEVIAAGVGVLKPVREPELDEPETLREYNAALIRKLEKKLVDLETANKKADLEHAERQAAEDRSRQLFEETERSRLALLMILEDQKAAEIRIREQLDELRRWESVTVGREDRVLQLKEEVNELLEQLNQSPRYVITDQE